MAQTQTLLTQLLLGSSNNNNHQLFNSFIGQSIGILYVCAQTTQVQLDHGIWKNFLPETWKSLCHVIYSSHED